MSEFQYYEFRAIDRPLGQAEMDALRKITSRAQITPVSLINTYHWGDFKGDPAKLVDRYFDAFVYVSNWGTYEFMLRIPRGGFDVEAARAYCDDETLTIKVGKEHVVLDFLLQDESGDDWSDGEEDATSWMPSLVCLRDELMRGDLRALYLGWLASLPKHGWDVETDDDLREPPVPPGLGKLSGPQRALAGFLHIEDALIDVAAEGSVGDPPAGPSPAEVARWVGALASAEKDSYLLRLLAQQGDASLRAEMLRRLREQTKSKGVRPPPEAERRTVAALLADRDALVDGKNRKAAERAAQEKDRREKEQAEARSKHLDDLALRETQAWDEVEAMVASKLPKEYDRAVALLVDLRGVAERSGRSSWADARIRELRQRHAKKPSFLGRLDAKGV